MKKNRSTILVDDEPRAIANLEALLINHPEIRIIETIPNAREKRTRFPIPLLNIRKLERFLT